MSRKQNKQSSSTARLRRESLQKYSASNSSRKRSRRGMPRQRNPLWLIGSLIAGVIIIVIVFIYISDNQPIAGVIGPTDPSIMSQVSHVKPSVFTAVGDGGTQNQFKSTGNTTIWTGQDGKPEIFYYGAEFCPYCAAQRWSMAIALSRFGTFSKLPLTRSGEQDENIATFTFVQSQYRSSLIDFVPVEARDRADKALQTPAAHEQPIIKRYNVNGYPFMNIADQYIASALIPDPSVLQGLSQKDIAAKLSDPSDNVTKTIIGGANDLTAAICLATHDQPSSVCTQAPIPALEQKIKQSPNWRSSQTQG